MHEAFQRRMRETSSIIFLVSFVFLLKEIALSAWVEKIPYKFTRGILHRGLVKGSEEQWNQEIEDEVIKEMRVDHLIDKEKHLGTMTEYADKINQTIRERMVSS